MVRLCSTISYNFFADDKSYIKNKRYGKWYRMKTTEEVKQKKKYTQKKTSKCLGKHLCIVLWKSGNLFARKTLKGCTT